MLNSWNAQPHTSGKEFSVGLSLGSSPGLKFSYGMNVPGVAAKAMAGFLQRAPSTKRTFTIATGSDGGPVELPDDVLETLKQAGVSLPVPAQAKSEKMIVSNRAGEGGTLVANLMPAAIASSPEPAPAAQTQSGAEPNISPYAFDLHPRVAVNQGERGDPFTISSQSRREVVQSLGWKSMGCIWGGPVVALICLYVLFVYWGWL
jgi:hypothetical protein